MPACHRPVVSNVCRRPCLPELLRRRIGVELHFAAEARGSLPGSQRLASDTGIVTPTCHRLVMGNASEVSGIELRYLLTSHLFDSGPATVEELADALALACQGFRVSGRPSKSISDALRWEIGHGRVVRLKRGKYRAAWMPRTTEYRINQRVKALRANVAGLSLGVGQRQALSATMTAGTKPP